ncbi:MAG: MASE1 domain-containing protein [Nitrospira sp.]|nr:MASE1 domain-containing protein [Nitrospira sp.]
MIWWLGDAVGVLIVTPAIVLWASGYAINWSCSQFLEIGVSLTLLCLVALIVFQSGQAMTGPNYPLGFLMLSILIWVAVRLGPRENGNRYSTVCRNSHLGNLAWVRPLRPGRPK